MLDVHQAQQAVRASMKNTEARFAYLEAELGNPRRVIDVQAVQTTRRWTRILD